MCGHMHQWADDIDWYIYMVTIMCSMDSGDVRAPVEGVGMGGRTRATRGVRHMLARMLCHGYIRF